MRKHDKRKSGEIREFWLFAQTNLSIFLVGRVEKWENKRDLIFPNMEKWKDEKFIYLIEKKNEMIENEVGINLQLYLY